MQEADIMTSALLKIRPYAEIPPRERWLFKNKKALAQVRQGLKDAANKKIKYLKIK